MNYCTYTENNGEMCMKDPVLQVNDDCACEEHAPELAELSDIKWPIKPPSSVETS